MTDHYEEMMLRTDERKIKGILYGEHLEIEIKSKAREAIQKTQNIPSSVMALLYIDKDGYCNIILTTREPDQIETTGLLYVFHGHQYPIQEYYTDWLEQELQYVLMNADDYMGV